MPAALNGEAVTLDRELESLALYGYGVYTTFAVEHGSTQGFRHHLERLQRDSRAILGTAVSEDDVRHTLAPLLTGLDEDEPTIVRITVFARGFSLARPEAARSLNVLATTRPASQHRLPLALKTVAAVRPLAEHKTTDLTVALHARAQAQQDGFGDALLVSQDRITEGPTWNVFFIDTGGVITPPVSEGLLPGVTRRLILDALSASHIPFSEAEVPADSLERYDEAFVTSAGIGVVPVRSIDDVQFVPDLPIFRKIAALLHAVPKDKLID